MAKYEQNLKGNLNDLITWIHKDITNNNSLVSFGDGSDINLKDSRVAVRVYERYSSFGGSRVSMNITITETGEELFISVITLGGTLGGFFKNTIVEERFLNLCKESVENYIREQEK
jgi:hypothetical protein